MRIPTPAATRTLAALSGLAASLLAAAPASATWSIILMDTRTREIAVGSATCLSNFDLRAGTPVLIPGIGAATAQSFVDSTGQNRVFVRDRLVEGLDPQGIIAILIGFDANHQTRQYGIVGIEDGTSNTLAATFSGTSAGAWAGGLTGQFNYTHAGHESTIVYAIQGNILTGAPVVQQALQAVQNTPGDLTARMMAGMQAARAMGGDGRCSCPGSPTGCGSPPPSFSKSAHIAYMLTARAGDREGSNGIYRAGTSAIRVAAGDINGDGRADLITANAGAGSISISRNTTIFPSPLGYIEQGNIFKYASLPTTLPTGQSPRGVAVGDINNDGIPDIIVSNINSGTITIYRGDQNSPSGFGSPETRIVGSAPRNVILADLDGQNGPDIATINASAHAAVVMFNDGQGNFSQPQNIPVETGPHDIIAGKFIVGGGIDLAVACRASSRLVILANDGKGNFTTASSTPMLSGAAGMVVGDFDGDGTVDLGVSSDTNQRITIFLNDGQGELTGTSFQPGLTPAGVAAGDVNGDGRPDIVTAGGNRFAVMLNDGQGGLVLDDTYTVHGGLADVSLADLDDDGDLDIAAANPSLNSAMVIQNLGPTGRWGGEGKFNDGVGCATGDYFLNLNVAFQSTSAPDPVAQLQEQYESWRASLIGKPDAVITTGGINPPNIRADGESFATLTITPRNHQSEIVNVPISGVRVEPMAGSPAVTVHPPVAVGGGLFNVRVTAGTTPGEVRLRVTIDDGESRPVILMPDPVLTLVDPGACYANCDQSTVEPALNVDDFTCFINQFAAASALPHAQQVGHYANCDGSTIAPAMNVDDFTCFINEYAGGCR